MCTIKNGKRAKITYTLTLAGEKEIIDRAGEDRPAIFQFGKGQLIDGFEKNLTGLKAGDSFDFVIPAVEAYGPHDRFAVFDIPKDTFAVDGKVDEKMLQTGKTFPMRDNDGNRHIGKIIQVNDETVTMDFNHPLAGKDLHFKGKVLEVFD